jgi:hypothetical protein
MEVLAQNISKITSPLKPHDKETKPCAITSSNETNIDYFVDSYTFHSQAI